MKPLPSIPAPVPNPYHATVREIVPSWPSGEHPSGTYTSWARPTLEALRASVDAFLAPLSFNRKHQVDYCQTCPTCLASGKKPGCKRKACQTCNGRGTVALDFAFPPPEPGPKALRRIADRIDGYDRDDLGESPDY